MSVGRNEPCPCGSGKKYKKCCFKSDQVSQKLADTRRDANEILTEDTSIYTLWSEWRQARESVDFNFLYDLLDPNGELSAQFADRAEFVAQCNDGKANIPSGLAEFRHLFINEAKEAKLLQTVGENDPTVSKVQCECVEFLKTEKGWRFSRFDQKEITKDEPAPSLAMFD